MVLLLVWSRFRWRRLRIGCRSHFHGVDEALIGGVVGRFAAGIVGFAVIPNGRHGPLGLMPWSM